jgi:hypothetical protein
MRLATILRLAGAALAVLSSTAAAQAAIVPFRGPVHALRMTADGALHPGAAWNPAGDVPGTTFANVTTSGLFAMPPAGEEWLDWGAKSGGLTGVACTLEIGYGTSALDPSLGGPGAALEVAVYAGTVGGCGASDVSAQARRLTFTGLPGSLDGSPAAYTIAVELVQETFALADGPIGWSYVGIDGKSGPLLITVGADPTSTIDGYDLYAPAPAAPGSCAGSFAFAAPGVASFYLRLEEDDGSEPGSQTPRAGSGVNLGVLSPAPVPPKIGQTWSPSITASAVGAPVLDFLAISSVPFPGVVVPGLGELLIGVAAPNPLAVVSTPVGSPFQVPFPLNCAYIGLSITSQGGQVDAGGMLGLTDALDFTFGI